MRCLGAAADHQNVTAADPASASPLAAAFTGDPGEEKPQCPRCPAGRVEFRYLMGDHPWFRCYGCGIEYPESAVFANRPWVPKG